MKFLLPFLLGVSLLKALPTKAQDFEKLRDDNDAIISEAYAYTRLVDSISRKDSFNYLLNGVKTRFYYLTAEGRLKGFSYTWIDGKKANIYYKNENVFYLRNNALYCASESIEQIYHGVPDMGWKVYTVFENGKETAITSVGHGKTEDDHWDSEKEMTQLYRQAFSIVQHYRQAHGPQSKR